MRLTHLACVVALVAMARFGYAGWLELAPDEAYYARWAAPPLSLFHRDHPPAVALMIAATTAAVGWTERAVRLVAILCAALTSLLAYAVAREAGLGHRVALGAPLLATVVLLPAVGAVIVTPDAPLMLFWTAGAWLLLRARRTGAIADWLCFGLAAGAALWSKHSGLLLLCAAWLAPAPGRQHRRNPRDLRARSMPAAATVVALLVAAPWLVAEADAGFGSFRYQIGHAFLPALRPVWAPLSRLGELLLAQVALLTPVVAWEAAVFLRRPAADPTNGGLYALAVVPLAAVALSALARHPEASWAAPAYPALVVGALCAWSRRPAGSRRNVAVAGLVTAITLAAVVHVHAVSPFLPVPPLADPSGRLHGWRSLVRALGGGVPVAAADYGVAAELWFYSPAHPDVRVGRPSATWPRFTARRADGAAVRRVPVLLGP